MSKLAHAGASTHRAARRAPARTPSAPPPTCRRRRAPATRPPSAATNQRPRLADRDDRRLPRARSGSRRSPKSPPLNRPPRITTSPRSKLSIARRAASMLVAFESLTNRTPPISPTGSSACSRPREPFDRARHRRPASTPASDATAAAASTSASRCRPSSWIDDSGTSGCSPPRRAARRSRRRRRRCPRRAPLLSANSSRARARVRASASDGRIVGVDHRPVVRASGSRRSAPSRRAYSVDGRRADRDDPARSSAAPQSTDGTCRSLSS